MTIVVDTSALVAVVLGEVEAERLLEVMQGSDCIVSSVSVVESGIVVEARQGLDAARDLDLLINAVARVAPVDEAQAAAAIEAWRRFGKGRHPARLNFGDCFSYALARSFGHPLLFKGDDFAQTDIASIPDRG